MKFVLVKCVSDRFLPLRQWRATHVEARTIDVFFWAPDEREAKAHVRRHFPTAYFHDEVYQ
jgi:hypothetical protein